MSIIIIVIITIINHFSMIIKDYSKKHAALFTALRYDDRVLSNLYIMIVIISIIIIIVIVITLYDCYIV